MARNAKIYLTKDGLAKFKREYEKLKALRARKLEDEAPNALHSDEIDVEFAAFKDDIDFLNLRLEELEYILRNYEPIVPPAKNRQNEIHLGAQVEVEVDGDKDEFVIVGTLEAGPADGKLSNESPIGQLLIGRKTGEEVVINSKSPTIYKIKSIKYSK
ncbi:MAG: GreA/GreB family elongation factor [Patescibacteria group bacterium]|nr:GreA/GreB family elongation factor [Patescibacteria group bacterium]